MSFGALVQPLLPVPSCGAEGQGADGGARATLRTGLVVAGASARPALAERYASARFVVASPEASSSLRVSLEDAVESALALRGALPPAVPVGADPWLVVRDELARLRALGALGLALFLPRLPPSFAPAEAPSEDIALVSAWIAAALTQPGVCVAVDPADADARLLVPTRLGELLEGQRPSLSPRVAEARAELAPPAEANAPGASAQAPRTSGKPAESPSEAAPRALPATVEGASVDAPPARISGLRRGLRRPAAPAETPDAPDASETSAPANPLGEGAPVEAAAPAGTPAPPATERRLEGEARRPSPPALPSRVVSAAEWRAFAAELDAARGPRPVGLVEKLFVTRYVPLLGAVARGEVDQTVRAVVEGFRAGFAHSYTEAFGTMRLTGKRPPMVFDAPEIASRIGRQNGAKSVKLLLVDGMRFDVGERLLARLKELLGRRAVCVERALLWSALPTTTPIQASLIGRGESALRDPAPVSEVEPGILRGRAVTTLRRERMGPREVMKLDLLEARLAASGEAAEARLDALADEAAPIVARFLDALPPRTLLFVFGDHGFRLPVAEGGASTGPAAQGGASPEEVLVPGYAWLASGVH